MHISIRTARLLLLFRERERERERERLGLGGFRSRCGVVVVLSVPSLLFYNNMTDDEDMRREIKNLFVRTNMIYSVDFAAAQLM